MKSKMWATILIALLVLFMVISFSLWNKNIEISKNRDEANMHAQKLQKEFNILSEKYSSVEKEYKQSEIKHANMLDLSNYHIRRMKQKGLNDPVQDLVQDLKEHPEFITEKGVLGGSMGFYFDKKIWVLTNEWVLAYYEDGHNGGYLLLHYNVSNDGSIDWKTIATHES